MIFTALQDYVRQLYQFHHFYGKYCQLWSGKTLLVVRTLLDSTTAVFQCYTTYASVSLLHCLLIVCLPLPQQNNKHPTLTDIIQLFLYLCVCFIVCRLVVVCLFVCLPLPQEDNKHPTLTDLIQLFLCTLLVLNHRREVHHQPPPR